jgi:alkaline phosphatase D
MKIFISFLISILLISCNTNKTSLSKNDKSIQNDFVIAFGSCNNQFLKNDLWPDIEKNRPDIWIWSGDIIYADTHNMKLMESYYELVKNNDDYKNFRSKVPVIGTWDDHDFGVNDGGTEYIKKDSAQQLLLNFLDVGPNDKRRKRKGVYHSQIFNVGEKKINIIVLDTRYFRTPLTFDPTGENRYVPDLSNEGTILGEEQWKWLEKELSNTNANFNLIVSSIQFLSYEHGFETWGNMPHEVEKLKKIIVNSNAQRVILLSGDRHISEISSTKIDGLKYPLYDFTSSGLTHTYEEFISEPNQYRISKVIKEKNFGVLKLDLINNTVNMEIRGLQNNLLESVIQKY